MSTLNSDLWEGTMVVGTQLERLLQFLSYLVYLWLHQWMLLLGTVSVKEVDLDLHWWLASRGNLVGQGQQQQ